MNGSDSTFTFQSDAGTGKPIFEFTIKAEFLKIVDPTTIPLQVAMTEHRMGKYLHNPTGPAIKNLQTGYEQYWLEGAQVDEEVANKIKHATSFNDTLEDILKA